MLRGDGAQPGGLHMDCEENVPTWLGAERENFPPPGAVREQNPDPGNNPNPIQSAGDESNPKASWGGWKQSKSKAAELKAIQKQASRVESNPKARRPAHKARSELDVHMFKFLATCGFQWPLVAIVRT